MKIPDWRTLTYDSNVVPEPTSEDNRITLWLFEGHNKKYLHWERVRTTPHAGIFQERAIYFTAATSICAKQKIRNRFSKLFFGSPRSTDYNMLLLPNGEFADPSGRMRSDLLLVWTSDKEATIDINTLRVYWPSLTSVRRINSQMVILYGIKNHPTASIPRSTGASQSDCPRPLAESLLEQARAAGDQRGLVLRLTDLGAIRYHERDLEGALELLIEASEIAAVLDDALMQCDVLGNLGKVVMYIEKADALALFKRELNYATVAADLYAEKVALEHLGLTYVGLANPESALAMFNRALRLARDAADPVHEATLLWYLSILHAELGLHQKAVIEGRAAVELLERLMMPEASWFRDRLSKYEEHTISKQAANNELLIERGSSIATILKEAIESAHSLAKFIGSGFTRVADETYRERIGICNTCSYGTGVRCRVCGCFTNLKAQLTHERCPVGKWHAVDGE